MFRRRNNPERKVIGELDDKYLPDLEKVAQLEDVVHKAHQEILKELQGKPEVVRDILTTETIQLEFCSDWHIGNGTVDGVSIKERIKNGEQHDNVAFVFLGDVLEAIKSEYTGTNINQTHSNLTIQVAKFREMTKKLVSQGKVLGMVSEYDGHSGGWPTEKVAYDLYQAIRGDNRIPLIQTGGRLVLRFIDPDSDPKNPRVIGVKTFDLYHAPPAGSTDQNPTAGLSNDAFRKKSRRPDGAASAHKHIGGYSIEVDPHGDELICIQEGTVKGSNPDLPQDRMFLGKSPGRRPHRSGGHITLRKDRSGKIVARPGYGRKQADIDNDAFSLLDYAEANKLTGEFYGEIKSKTAPPTIKFDPRSSIKDSELLLETRNNGVKDLENEELAEIPSPERPETQYSKLVYRIETDRPFIIRLASNFFIGSGASKGKKFQQMREGFIHSVEGNDDSSVILLARVLDKSVAGNPSRRSIVEDEVATPFEELGADGRVLGVMLDKEGFRLDRWAQSIKGDAPFMPGTFLAKRLNTKLYNHLSSFLFRVGPKNGRNLSEYSLLAVDRVGQQGSTLKAFNGLRGIDLSNRTKEEYDLIVGGHTPWAGVLEVQDPYSATPQHKYVVTGHFSKYTEQGKGNRRDVSPGAPGILVLPDTKLAVVEMNDQQLDERYLAYLLLFCLPKIGVNINIR